MNQTMLRQVSSRNGRSKGLKVKKALQLFLILALTIWLLFQVKHSYDKKILYDKNPKPVSISSLKEELITNTTPQEEMIKFGRKNLPQKDEKNKIKISERDTNIDENYEDEETVETEEEEEEETAEAEETEELEKDETGADSEESTLLEDEESGKDEISEARERSFHGDNVASAVTHDVNLTWHDDYLDNINKNNKGGNYSSSSLTNGTNLVVESESERKRENETGLVSELKEKTSSVNLTNGIVVSVNETVSSVNILGLNLDEKEKKNLSVVGDNANETIDNLSVSLSPIVKNEDEKRNDSHIETMGVNVGGDVVFE